MWRVRMFVRLYILYKMSAFLARILLIFIWKNNVASFYHQPVYCAAWRKTGADNLWMSLGSCIIHRKGRNTISFLCFILKPTYCAIQIYCNAISMHFDKLTSFVYCLWYKYLWCLLPIGSIFLVKAQLVICHLNTI